MAALDQKKVVLTSSGIELVDLSSLSKFGVIK